MIHLCKTSEETFELGRTLAAKLKGKEILILTGDLGAGKTVFVQGVADFFGAPSEEVASPSFTLMNIYRGRFLLFHMDLYRMGEEEAEEILGEIEGEGIVLVEWGEKVEWDLFEKASYRITFRVNPDFTREIDVQEV